MLSQGCHAYVFNATLQKLFTIVSKYIHSPTAADKPQQFFQANCAQELLCIQM
jgi:hypothetical protein